MSCVEAFPHGQFIGLLHFFHDSIDFSTAYPLEILDTVCRVRIVLPLNLFVYFATST